MPLPFRIAIAGGIATGKTTVTNYLKEQGCKIIDADEIARKLFHKYHLSYYLVWIFFGNQVFDGNQVSRGKLASLVFNNESKRKTLNRITHPFVIWTMFWQYIYLAILGHKYVFFDIPLLFESHLNTYANQIWVVYVDKETQKLRLLSRMRKAKVTEISNLTEDEEEMLKRVDVQMSIEKKKNLANIVIKNTGPLNECLERIRYLVCSLEDENLL
eukprot:NODE_19_length_47148_cov_1.447810.p29 type:complete len:215 gc:universal NODE_19_length_47148_cov_1.447810:35154-34510(-)